MPDDPVRSMTVAPMLRSPGDDRGARESLGGSALGVNARDST